MKATSRVVSLSRHRAPPFVLVAGLELLQLRKLSWLARCVFLELVAMADFATGRVETSYAVLAALLDFDTHPTAHRVDKPSMQRLRTATQELVMQGLLRVDRDDNEAGRRLFFRVEKRVGISASDDMSNRQSNRPKKPAKQAPARPADVSGSDEQQTEQQGVQEYTPAPEGTGGGGVSPKVVHSRSAEKATSTTEPDMRSLTLRPSSEATAPPTKIKAVRDKLAAQIAAERRREIASK